MHRNPNKPYRQKRVTSSKQFGCFSRDLVQFLDDEWPPKTTRRRRKRAHHILWDAIHQETESLVSDLLLHGQCVVGDLAFRHSMPDVSPTEQFVHNAILDGRPPFLMGKDSP